MSVGLLICILAHKNALKNQKQQIVQVWSALWVQIGSTPKKPKNPFYCKKSRVFGVVQVGATLVGKVPKSHIKQK